MKKFTIKAEWIKKINFGYNSNWGYDYKEYIFNENYTEAYSLRIPQNALGIQAMLFSNDSGIKDEYDVVSLVNGDTENVIFDISKQLEGLLLHENKKLQDQVLALELQLSTALGKLEAIAGIAG